MRSQAVKGCLVKRIVHSQVVMQRNVVDLDFNTRWARAHTPFRRFTFYGQNVTDTQEQYSLLRGLTSFPMTRYVIRAAELAHGSHQRRLNALHIPIYSKIAARTKTFYL
jgi:hypothetical protein